METSDARKHSLSLLISFCNKHDFKIFRGRDLWRMHDLATALKDKIHLSNQTKKFRACGGLLKGAAWRHL